MQDLDATPVTTAQFRSNKKEHEKKLQQTDEEKQKADIS